MQLLMLLTPVTHYRLFLTLMKGDKSRKEMKEFKPVALAYSSVAAPKFYMASVSQRNLSFFFLKPDGRQAAPAPRWSEGRHTPRSISSPEVATTRRLLTPRSYGAYCKSLFYNNLAKLGAHWVPGPFPPHSHLSYWGPTLGYHNSYDDRTCSPAARRVTPGGSRARGFEMASYRDVSTSAVAAPRVDESYI